MIKRVYFFFLLLLFAARWMEGHAQEVAIYEIKEGSVYFKSDAPLEMIEANSEALKGLIDFENETFAFTVAIGSFEGFNSSLQREHFNENYLESARYPRATFSGKMIEKADVSQNGEYVIRAKGKLVIHGVEQERIIRTVLQVKDGIVHIHAPFTVLLQEHNISIPKVVYQKIAEQINVEIKAVAVKR